MEIGRLEAFVRVAQLRSFSKAADALYLTQPTVTARIQALERELGEPLFERMGRTIRLTDAGAGFLPHAQRALQSLVEGKDALVSLRDVQHGTLAIGTAPTVGTYVLPGLLERFGTRFPGVEITIRTGRSEEVMAMVLADEVQVGLRTLPGAPGYRDGPLVRGRHPPDGQRRSPDRPAEPGAGAGRGPRIGHFLLTSARPTTP